MDNKIKIRVAFDPTDVWDQMFFREFIKALIYDEDNYEVYLVTTNTDSVFVSNVEEESGINTLNVNQVSNNSAVVARLNTLGALIYLCEDNVLVNLINNTLPIQLTANNVTGCQSLILNNIIDEYLAQQKYITKFHFWVDQINKKY